MNQVEASLLRNKILKNRYSSEPLEEDVNRTNNIKDIDMLDEEDDEEEVEAFIKKRVKEGSGKEYDQIIRKDVVAYKQAGHLKEGVDFLEINKYESSKAYKSIKEIMEVPDETHTTQISNDMIELESNIKRDEYKIAELQLQEENSKRMILEADA